MVPKDLKAVRRPRAPRRLEAAARRLQSSWASSPPVSLPAGHAGPTSGIHEPFLCHAPREPQGRIHQLPKVLAFTELCC
jgi:hypothetical protein